QRLQIEERRLGSERKRAVATEGSTQQLAVAAKRLADDKLRWDEERQRSTTKFEVLEREQRREQHRSTLREGRPTEQRFRAVARMDVTTDTATEMRDFFTAVDQATRTASAPPGAAGTTRFLIGGPVNAANKPAAEPGFTAMNVRTLK